MLESPSCKISNKILATHKLYHSSPLKLQEYFVLYIALNFGSHFFNHNDDFLIKFFTEILISAQLYIDISICLSYLSLTIFV